MMNVQQDTLRKTYEALKAHPWIQYPRLARLVGVPYDSIRRYVRILVRQGIATSHPHVQGQHTSKRNPLEHAIIKELPEPEAITK